LESICKGNCAPSAALSIENVIEADVAPVIVGRVMLMFPLVSFTEAESVPLAATILEAGKAAEIS
jgi:hypothetical protein